MIVVDLGCCAHEGDQSVEPLVERFKPRVLLGFDPLLHAARSYKIDDTLVVLKAEAAWTYDGVIDLAVGYGSSLDATVVRDKHDRGEWDETTQVPCFDFVEWLRYQHHREAKVLKLNIEGAEFELLEHLHASLKDEWFDRIIVAWHDDRLGGGYPERRAKLEAGLRCPVEEWTPRWVPECV